MNQARDTAWREFHISRDSRERYGFDELIFKTDGRVVLENFGAARTLSQKMNAARDLARFPEQAVKAAHIHAMGLIDEILHHVVARFREEKNPDVLPDALSWLDKTLGSETVDKALEVFTREFPPLAVQNEKVAPHEYLSGRSDGTLNRHIALEEMLMLWLSNLNPALEPFGELFDDTDLQIETAYAPLMESLREFFKTQPPFGPDNLNLIEMLRAPALAAPGSLSAQLEYLLGRAGYLAPGFLQRLLTGLDFIREEEKASFSGPGPSLVPTYGAGRSGAGRSGVRQGGAGSVGLDEPERFSEDRDWMPRAVLMAKNAYVWRDQLSKKYNRSIRTLDQIPDEELDALAAQGFTGLWLIGLWERSSASQRIKQMCGNEDAVASAYSLHDYVIAHDLGGPDAMHDLRERAGRRGLKMASDMVPNHMAIDSRWMVEHPDWFVALDHSPFPSYTFNGPDLSRDDRVGIFLEDHYYSKSDAAVVFKRVDYHTGTERLVYHGNDGTSMPWNDTAQLDYLKSEVREAVIQTILHVARQFPIIRFDAAMTLAKRHYQRLWFPEPGSGGAIPSRAEHGLSSDDFNAAFPEEFWREVVDRVAQEAPDTLLLAEAFWMMEGYFVRTLGMHRVYNSAFMNMLRDEENDKYRLVLKNTLEFDPDIMKRFVNFMNNPDEDTAIEQFGSGGKYFGVCTLMATLPGLPMFGHGQLEGFREKYGMEYQRAYWDERPDAELTARHEREIFPLLKRRHIFAEVRDFLLYDFWLPDGSVNEDVFAYSNRSGEERALVIFHNKYAEAKGWIRTSVGAARKAGNEKRIEQQTLGNGLGLSGEGDQWTLFRDNVSDLEYIRSSAELCERGLYAELGAYECHVFMGFREVRDNAERHYERIASQLNGRGVPNVETALLEMLLEPVHAPFRDLVNAGFLRRLMEPQLSQCQPAATQADTIQTSAPQDRVSSEPAEVAPASPQESPIESSPDSENGERENAASLDAASLDVVENKARVLARAIRAYKSDGRDAAQSGEAVEEEAVERVARAVRENVASVLRLPVAIEGESSAYLCEKLDEASLGALLMWAIMRELGDATASASRREAAGSTSRSRDCLDELLLNRLIADALCDLGMNRYEAERVTSIVRVLAACDAFLPPRDEQQAGELLHWLFRDEEARRLLGVNHYNDVWWFNRDALEEVLWWIFAVSVVSLDAPSLDETQSVNEQSVNDTIMALHSRVLKLQQQAQASDYQVERFVAALPS